MEGRAEQQRGGWEAQLDAAGGAGAELTGGECSAFMPAGDMGAFYLPSECRHPWTQQQGMHFEAAAAAQMWWGCQALDQHPHWGCPREGWMLAPPGSTSLLRGAADAAAARGQWTSFAMGMGARPSAASVADADHHEMGHAAAGSLECVNLQLREENQALRAIVDRLRGDLWRLQGCNSRLRAFHAQAALGPMEDLQEEDRDGGERIHLLSFSRHPQAFRLALSHATPLQECRLALVQANFKWELDCGAKIFVHPHQFEETVALVNEKELKLAKQHVIVAECLMWNVMLSVFTLSSRLQVRAKARIELGAVAANASSNVRLEM